MNKNDIDPRLLEQINKAEDDEEVEAIIMVADDASKSDERGPAGPLLDRVAKRLKEKPSQVRFMPKLGVAYVKGSGKLVRQLLDQDGVISASANESGDIASPEKGQAK